MTLDPKLLTNDARLALAQQIKAPWLFTLLHSGVTAGAGILLALLDVLLVVLMDQAGGLSGIGLRSVLSTVVAFSDLLVGLLTPVWSLGLVFVALAFARQQQVSAGALTEGFRRLGPVVRTLLLESAVLFGAAMGIAWVSAMLISFLPVNPELEAFILANQDAFLQDPEAVLSQMPTGLMLETMLPALVLTLVLTLAAIVPLSYRLRFMRYAVMDKPGTGAFAALAASMRATKGNCLRLFKLDLSFWWYYAISLVLSLVLSLDSLLPFMGIALPVSSELAALICYGLYAAGALALARFVSPLIITTYAKAYLTANGE